MHYKKTGTAKPAKTGRMRCSRASESPGPASGPPLALLHASGIHATIAGVVLGFTIPVLRSQAQATMPIGSRISHAAAGWTPKKRRYFWARNA